MRKFLLLTTTLVGLTLVPAFAQPGAGGTGPHLGGAMNKLFGANQIFSATMEIQTAAPDGSDIIMPGTVSYDGGKFRFEINLSQVQGGGMPAAVVQQLKTMGMDIVITISRPDLKLSYLVYPGINSYAEVPLKKGSASTSLDDYKMDTTELGKETVDGHDCVKNKVTVTDKEGARHESTVWNATDLKNFPVKIEATEEDQSATMRFKNITFDKPAASLFEPPTGLTKYNDAKTMLQTEMMKKMGGGPGLPPAGH
ncbi:MAG: DUF4412 domain-containing protein [Verrucomicrobiota bacterium]